MNTSAYKERCLTKQQIKIIHTLINKLKLAEDDYRSGLMRAFGVSSSKLLTYEQAGSLIKAYQEEVTGRGIGNIPQNKHEQLGNRKRMATPPQLTFINGLWNAVSMGKDDVSRNHGLRTFLAKTVKVSDKRFLTKTQAIKVIEILKQVKNRSRLNTTVE